MPHRTPTADVLLAALRSDWAGIQALHADSALFLDPRFAAWCGRLVCRSGGLPSSVLRFATDSLHLPLRSLDDVRECGPDFRCRLHDARGVLTLGQPRPVANGVLVPFFWVQATRAASGDTAFESGYTLLLRREAAGWSAQRGAMDVWGPHR